MSLRKVLWLRWTDPMAGVYYSSTPSELDAELEAKHDSLYRDDDVKWEDPHSNQVNIGPFLSGPGGIIPLHENMLPGKLFNFWVGHTNFDLGQDNLVARIERTDGVETLDIITRYRFRVGIGRAFDQDKVKIAVENSLCGFDGWKRMLATKYPHWMILSMPSGQVEVFGGNTKDEVVASSKERAGLAAKVIASWD